MKYIQSPDEYTLDNSISVFLAGGISNCFDWQYELVKMLSDTKLTIINPRRKDFDVNNKLLAKEQIEWEYHHLSLSDVIVFWFAPETVCPITLFEYGKYLNTWHRVILGIHPDYSRKEDLEIQTSLYDKKNDVKIVYDLVSLSEEIKKIT